MLTYSLEEKDKKIKVTFIGKADNDGNKIFQEALDKLIELKPEEVDMNFKNLRFINSLGLGKFIRFYKNYQFKFGHIVISEVNEDIYKILKSISMEKLVKITKA